jgi:hypothetical protein
MAVRGLSRSEFSTQLSGRFWAESGPSRILETEKKGVTDLCPSHFGKRKKTTNSDWV